jgi:hypothetical protein
VLGLSCSTPPFPRRRRDVILLHDVDGQEKRQRAGRIEILAVGLRADHPGGRPRLPDGYDRAPQGLS